MLEQLDKCLMTKYCKTQACDTPEDANSATPKQFQQLKTQADPKESQDQSLHPRRAGNRRVSIYQYAAERMQSRNFQNRREKNRKLSQIISFVK